MLAKVTFAEEYCKGCGLCVSFCPKELISFDTTRLNKNAVHPPKIDEMDKCVACCSCAIMCPDACITIEK